jgi:hypothetical protein
MKLIGTVSSVTAAIALTAALATPVFASLGGDATSVQADLARVKGSLRTTATTSYTVHEISTSFGTVVREYLSPSGKVFAVSWHGPVIPDLRQVLGSYYGQYEQAASAPHADGHRHLNIEQPGLIVQSSGRMRSFYGRAWAPNLLPQNFSVDLIN